MQRLTIRTIREEHAALAAMLHSIPLLIQQYERRGETPDFTALRAMLFYIDEFPERRHHRKESELLFPMLRARSTLLNDELDRLDRDHAQGERRIRDLEHALLGYEMMGESRREAFEQMLRAYVAFYASHMAFEERQVLPFAERVLTPQDWAQLDAAFAANRDPMTGHAPDAEYQALFRRILNLLPAPIGLGPAGDERSAARTPAS